LVAVVAFTFNLAHRLPHLYTSFSVTFFQLPDARVSIDKPHVEEVSVTTQFTLINRTFLAGNVTSKVRCMWPVRIVQYMVSFYEEHIPNTKFGICIYV